MRRVLLFAAFLLLLGLTTATAASFDVQAEDITSFSTDVSISVPTPPVSSSAPWFLFRAPPAPGGISQTPDTGGPHKWKVDPLSPGATALTESDVNRYYVFSTGVLVAPMDFQHQRVTFNVYLTAGGNAITALLLDCPAGAPLASSSCAEFATGSSATAVVDLGIVDRTVEAGRELRLKLVNTGTQFWQVEWGYKTNRESNLTVSAPLP